MKICLVEPFDTGSHASWAREYARFSRHDVRLLTMDGRYWKWRMHGGAVTLAQEFMACADQPDILLVSDMLDLTTFLALTRERTAQIPTALYFHENQLTYPWSPDDCDPGQQRDAHYAFINYTSALAADRVYFNSRYHLESFFSELPGFLKSFPDHNCIDNLQGLRENSRVLPLGLDLQQLAEFRPDTLPAKQNGPLILWNHRWEYDKNPEIFFQVLYRLLEEGLAFQVALLGESYRKSPAIFDQARQKLGERIVHYGYIENDADYARWLWQADILPVTSNHDFFGASVVQAIFCGCTPLLPRRLAYPEHLPESRHDLYLYNDTEDLLERLRHMLSQPAFDTAELQAYVARYDWRVQVEHYDHLLESIAG